MLNGTSIVSSSAQVLVDLQSSGIFSSSAQLPSGLVSSSAQLPSGTVSSSAQIIIGLQSTSIVSSSAQVLVDLQSSGIHSSSAQLPSGIISSSAQLPSGIVSSSAQTIVGLQSTSIVSSSAQVLVDLQSSGIVSSSAQLPSSSWASSSISSSYSLTASYVNVSQNVLNLTTGSSPTFSTLILSGSGAGTLSINGYLYGYDPLLTGHTGTVEVINGSVQLDFGWCVSSPYNPWIQARQNTSAYAYGLSINPLGGNVGIGTTSPNYKLDVNGSGNFTGSVNGLSFNTTSARRFKDNILTFSQTSALDRVIQLRPVSFDWKKDGRHDLGLIAEEVEQVVPEVVSRDPAGDIAGLDYSRLTALLIAAMQKQQSEIEELRGEIALLKNRS